MSVSPMEFLEYARSVLGSSEDAITEMDIRVSINRAYYGTYHRALEISPALNVPTSPSADDDISGSHKRLYTKFQQGTRGLKAIGDMLKNMHRTRCLADYRLESLLERGDALKHYHNCLGLMQRLDTLANSQKAPLADDTNPA